MEAITLTRKDYEEGIAKAGESIKDGESYTGQFTVNFAEGLNTASALEICRCVQDGSMESKIRITKICIADKPVEIVCPNGEKSKFRLTNAEQSLEGFELFQKEPLALIALSDAVYGYILKKSLRLPKPNEAVAQTPKAYE